MIDAIHEFRTAMIEADCTRLSISSPASYIASPATVMRTTTLHGADCSPISREVCTVIGARLRMVELGRAEPGKPSGTSPIQPPSKPLSGARSRPMHASARSRRPSATNGPLRPLARCGRPALLPAPIIHTLPARACSRSIPFERFLSSMQRRSWAMRRHHVAMLCKADCSSPRSSATASCPPSS